LILYLARETIARCNLAIIAFSVTPTKVGGTLECGDHFVD